MSNIPKFKAGEKVKILHIPGIPLDNLIRDIGIIAYISGDSCTIQVEHKRGEKSFGTMLGCLQKIDNQLLLFE